MNAPLQYTGQWVISGKIDIPFGFLLDPVSILMLLIVAVITFLVQVYSIGYMAGDPGFSRYYAFLSLFGWAMESLAVSPNLLQLYIFWEIVGLSSYLLIGFWYQKFSASQAGKKAFVMTRLGDIAFFLGLLLLLFHTGCLDIATLGSCSCRYAFIPDDLVDSAHFRRDHRQKRPVSTYDVAPRTPWRAPLR